MRKVLFWSTTLIAFLLLSVAFLHPTQELSLDLGEHIRFGELIVKNHIFPTTNIFSYTYPNASFIHQEFIPDIVFYLLFHSVGISGLILFTTIIVFASFGTLFFYAKNRVSPLVLFSATILYFRILFERTYVRPEIFSYLFLSLFSVILLTYRKRFTKWIYLLIPLQFLWMNSHIYFIFGLFLTTVVFIEFVITRQFKYREKDIKILGIVLALSALVCLINPNGLSGVLYPFTVFNNYGFSVEENNSIFTIQQQAGHIVYSIVFFETTAILLFLFLCWNAKKSNWFSWIVSLSFIYLASFAIRNFPLFIFGTFIPFTLLFNNTYQNFLSRTNESISRYKSGLLFGAYGILIAIFIWHIYLVVSIQGIGVTAQDSAKKGVDFFVNNYMQGPIFNNYGIGSYLVFRLYPKEKVFVDGRPEAYPASFFTSEYIPMQTDANLFATLSKKFSFNTIVYDYPAEQTYASQVFLKNISTSPEWKMIYLDETVVIFVKNSLQNQNLVKKYGITEQTFRFPNNISEQSLASLIYFFNTVGWGGDEEKTYQALLAFDPNNCAALAHEISYLSNKNDASVSVLTYRYESVCQ